MQLAIFAVISLVAGVVMVFRYIQLPAMLLGTGHYTVRVDLPAAGGLYPSGNVTFRGTEVGRVERVQLTQTGVTAVLSLKSGIKIPSDLDAQVHSQSAVGEQFVALLPRNSTAPPLKDGDVIPLSRTSVPPDINALLDATNRGLQAIPHDALRTAINESYTAVGSLGPDLARLIRGSTTLSIDAHANLDSLLTLIDQSKPVLDSQTKTADSVQGWAAHLAKISKQLQSSDAALQGVLRKGPGAADAARALFDQLRPTLPIVLANLTSLNRVAITYQPALEQLLVLFPQATASLQATNLANRNVKTPYNGAYLDFALNLNAPPPCVTGFLPPAQRRTPSDVDAPDRPAGDLYCRVPQDSPLDVRGARNLPCLTVRGKRAPTVKMCESSESYKPLNDGFAWKGDPNATLSGQGVPQLAPGASGPPPAPPPPIAAAAYDPITGTYVGPDGHTYTQASLAQDRPQNQTWQSMLLPPPGS